MAPSSQWVVDYREDSCALRRTFRAGDHQATLQLRQFGPGDSFEVTLLSDTVPRTTKAPRVRFEPDDDFIKPPIAFLVSRGEAHGVRYTDSFRPSALKQSPAPWPQADREARERAITGLAVVDTYESPIVLQTGEMSEPMEAMRPCLDELLVRWGLDPAEQRTLSRAVKPADPMGWARRVQQSFPVAMLRDRRSATVQLRLIVGADGKPTSCMPPAGSSEPAFQEHACKVSMRNARFEPALDANGKPVASFYSTAVTYSAR